MRCEIWVRRHWSDVREAKVNLADLSGFQWDTTSGGLAGGFGVVAPQPFVHAYVWCDSFIEGEVAHSCAHGPPPHQIKVCIVKKSNRKIFPLIKVLPVLEKKRREIQDRLHSTRDHTHATKDRLVALRGELATIGADCLLPFFRGYYHDRGEEAAETARPGRWLTPEEVRALGIGVPLGPDAPPEHCEAWALGRRVAEKLK